MIQFARELVYLAAVAGWALASVIALELIAPKGRPTWFSRLRGGALFSIYVLMSSIIAASGSMAMEALHIRPLFEPLPPIAAGVSAAIATDFFYYWCHRAQHRWFWRFHAVHHSIRELSGVNSYHHWTDEFFRVVLVSVPVTLLAPVGVREPVIGLLLVLQTYLLHADTRLNFGKLRAVVADNRYHRIHHSIESRHFDRNFAASFPIWDVLFGTAYWPAPKEWPATGVSGMEEPTTTREYMFAPFARSAPRESGSRNGMARI